MSRYTSLILYIPALENETDRIKEVNSFKIANKHTINLSDVNMKPYPDLFPRFIYCGTYNYFDLNPFLEHIRNNVNWEYPEHVKLMVQEEEKEGLDVYTIV